MTRLELEDNFKDVVDTVEALIARDNKHEIAGFLMDKASKAEESPLDTMALVVLALLVEGM